MAEILFPNDIPVTTGMNSYYISLKQLIEFYKKEISCGCVHFRIDLVEALLFFDEKGLVDAVYLDENGKSTSSAAMELLNNEIKKQNFKLSVYAVQKEFLKYWVSLIYLPPIEANTPVSFKKFLDMLEKEYEGRPVNGYYRVQGDKRRQLGWVLFQDSRILGFRSPGEKASWMGPEEMPDFIDRFKSASEIHVDVWGLLGLRENKNEAVFDINLDEAIRILEELVSESELLVASLKGNSFSIEFRKACASWADIYEFLDPFVADLEYRAGELSFTGRVYPGAVIEGVFKALNSMMSDWGKAQDFALLAENWKKKHQAILSILQVRFSD